MQGNPGMGGNNYNQDLVKKEEDDHNQEERGGGKKQKEEWKCLDCKKSYKSYPAFYTHNKLKHDGKPPQHYDIPRSLEDIRKDRGRPRVTDSSNRIKFTLQDKHQQKCEDNIYEFLGKLGQKGDEGGQRENTVIRGYLKKPINPAEHFPVQMFANNEELFHHAQKIKEQITKLHEELQQRNEWEFVDPLELKPDDMSEFSIYNLKSLFYNLNEEQKVDMYTTLVVYFIWVSKELLPEAYREIIILSLNYCSEFWKNVLPIKEQSEDQFKTGRLNLKEEFKDNVDKYFSQYKLSLFEESDIQQYIEKFIQWYNHFDDNDSLDPNEYQHQQQNESGHLEEDEGDDIDEDDIEDQQQQGQGNQPGGDSTTHINPENMNFKQH